MTKLTTRTRRVEWEDPLETASARLDLSGLDHLREIRDGRVAPPPIAALMGFDLVDVDEGYAVFAVVPEEFHYNPIGVVHGGLAATMLDSATGCAVQSTLPAGVLYTTLELNVSFARPMTRDTGPVRCEASIVHRGKTVAMAEGRVVAEETGKLIAHGTATCLLMAANGHAA